ncbi:hypothetical protein [Allosphingosinicella indica]|uniref:Uncharacterized protein n=1 Tax=Allosphingosinicella indica TaxID=941907 RepID=A0A1X7GIX7_9SPHN|nr:hypothetical protein [Allosphingosinicella indica]SMF70491.1 hypothetical protein SAMN06295910_1882 [Allosphingosinicella indica]
MNDPLSAGEAGGIFAGVVALLALLGKGAQWLLNWNDARVSSRSAKLDAWHAELERREERLDAEQKAYQDRLESRLKKLEGENQALRLAFELVAVPLRAIDPGNPKLAQAEELLRSAFPLVPQVPAEMRAALGAID